MQGVFSLSERRCMCFPGYSGTQCNSPCPGNGTSAGVCWGHGACFTTGTLEGSCICQSGYDGYELVQNTNGAAESRLSCGGCSNGTRNGTVMTPAYYGGVGSYAASLTELNCVICPGGGTCSGTTWHGIVWHRMAWYSSLLGTIRWNCRPWYVQFWYNWHWDLHL